MCMTQFVATPIGCRLAATHSKKVSIVLQTMDFPRPRSKMLRRISLVFQSLNPQESGGCGRFDLLMRAEDALDSSSSLPPLLEQTQYISIYMYHSKKTRWRNYLCGYGRSMTGALVCLMLSSAFERSPRKLQDSGNSSKIRVFLWFLDSNDRGCHAQAPFVFDGSRDSFLHKHKHKRHPLPITLENRLPEKHGDGESVLVRMALSSI